VKWFRRAAEWDNADAQKRAEEFRRAAEQGIAEAQYNLGFMYLYGYGVAQDDAEAVKW